MDGPSQEKGELFAPCTCARIASRLAHRKCLARWGMIDMHATLMANPDGKLYVYTARSILCPA